MKITIPKPKLSSVIQNTFMVIGFLAVGTIIHTRIKMADERQKKNVEIHTIMAMAMEDNRTFARNLQSDLQDEVIMRRGQVKTLQERTAELERRVQVFETIISGRKLCK